MAGGSHGSCDPSDQQRLRFFPDSHGKKHSIALVTKSTTSAFWHSVKAGAGAAAAEYNLDFTFEGPEKEEDYETQNRMIREAVERGAEALVISAVDYNANAEAVDQAAKKDYRS